MRLPLLLLALATSPALAQQTGIASTYGAGDGFDGRRTANGERFSRYSMTCAHPTLPFGTWIRVSRKGRSVDVRVNDRGPNQRKYPSRKLDLSDKAGKLLGIDGLGHVTWRVLSLPRRARR